MKARSLDQLWASGATCQKRTALCSFMHRRLGRFRRRGHRDVRACAVKSGEAFWSADGRKLRLGT